MPIAPLKPCSRPSCQNLSTGGMCPKCRPKVKTTDTDRKSSSSRGYDRKWGVARLRYLARHPLCVECEQAGRIKPATVVDHIIPHKGDKKLFWLVSNWQSLCRFHHNSKTGRGE